MNYDIEALKRKLLVKYPFFGSVVASVSYKEIDIISTAATDGKVIYYNKEFLEKLSANEQTFVIAHEVCHIAFNHILRSEGKNQEIWNIATDGVINQFLKQDGLKIIDGAIDIAEAINYDAEELYNKLLQEKEQNQEQCSSDFQSDNNQLDSQQQTGNIGQSSDKEKNQEQNNESSGDNSQEESKQQDAGHDTHSMWSDAVKKHKEQEDSAKNNQNDDKKVNEQTKKQDEPKKVSEKETFKKNREEKKKNLEKLKEEITTEASKAGTTTNKDVREVGNIGYAKPIIDWRYALRETIKYDVDWSYKNATIEDGVVISHLEELPMPETEIVIDTSGSINRTLLRSFLRECKNILKYSKLKIGFFDVIFYGFHEIRTEEDIDNIEIIGAGGTNFDAAVNAFSRRVENKIIFTDGESLMPEKALDVIWMVFGNTKINPKGGKVVMISNEQLAKLSLYESTTNLKRTLKK